MAFQTIFNGTADCGPSNPLQNLLKHVQPDSRSSRFDRFDQPGPSHSSNTPNPSPSAAAPHQVASVRSRIAPNEMDSLRQDLEYLDLIGGQPVQGSSRGWHKQFTPASPMPLVTAAELAHMERSFRISSEELTLNPAAASTSFRWSQQFTNTLAEPDHHPDQPLSTPYSAPLPGRSLQTSSIFRPPGVFPQNLSLFAPPGLRSEPSIHEAPAKIVELSEENWEAEFAKIGDRLETNGLGQSKSSSERPSQTSQSTSTSNEPEAGVGAEEADEEDLAADAEFVKSLEATWRQLATNLNSASLSDPELGAWEQQFGHKSRCPHLAGHPPETVTAENVAEFLDDPAPYPFQTENPFMNHPDPFAEGERLVAGGATLSEAALAFEAACSREPERGAAWRMLGETQAADEKEQLAIKAFQKAVGCADADGQAAWMALAICWVNEGQEMRALAILERWLAQAYPALANGPSATDAADPSNPWDRHARVVEKFLRVARAGPAEREGDGRQAVRGQAVDGEVQVGLGVLFFSNSDYDRARDCFEAALGVNPSDFLLWNRLGATLANGGQSEEAVDAYRRALELRPTFTRAIYNLGVSCMNIHCYKEAVEHLLAALSLHRKADLVGSGYRPLLAGGDGSENLWQTLRRALICLDREDLVELANTETDVEVFRKHGFDF